MTRSFFVLFCLVSSLAGRSVLAQPTPKLNALSREWFQRGTTNPVVISGENLSGATAVYVSGDPGVTVRLVARPHSESPVTVEASRGGISVAAPNDAKKLDAELLVSADASLNGREVRLVTTAGSSNPVRINVSSIPEMLEAPAGKEPQKLQLPVGVSGVISAPGEQDTYSFWAKHGEKLIFDVLAFRTGSPLDSSLVLLSAAGQEVARSEDAKGFDSSLVFTVPEDGQYTVQLRDFRYGGSASHTYHLTMGSLPCIETVFPAGGARGQSVEVALAGVNLGGLDRINLRAEPNAPAGWQEIRVRTPGGLSTAFPFQVSDLPEVLETEPNNAINQANSITVPAVVNGRIGSAGDVDAFKLKLSQTQTLICEVTAQRFGSPLDALLVLQDATGKVLQQNDDAEGADARIEFAFQKDVEYTLLLRDLLDRGGDAFVYRLSIRSPQPDFTVKFSPDTPRLQRGGRALIRCEVTRTAGFNGAVQIECTDLPPGITAETLLLKPESPTNGFLTISSSETAVPGTFRLKVHGTGVIDGKRVMRPAEPLSGEMTATDAFVTVQETTAPFTLDLVTLSLLLEQDQSGAVDVLVQRRAGFDGEVKLTAEGYSSGRESLTRNVDVTNVTLKAGETRATLRLKAHLDSEIGLRQIHIKGEATVDGQGVTQFSQSMPLTVQQIPFTLLNTVKRVSVAVLPAGAKSAASEAEFTVKASRRGWFTDQIKLSLEGLPEGVTVTSTNLASQVAEVTFKLATTDKAPASKDFQVTVVGSATAGGRTYEQRTAPMTLSITKPQEIAEAR